MYDGSSPQSLKDFIVLTKSMNSSKNNNGRQSSEYSLSTGKYSDPVFQSMPMVSKTKDAL
jgi:hypothetical protein